MSFFNNKEEVIDFQLTQLGKQSLIRGELNPVYYAFFDDDIIYNSETYGVEELQNETQQRIQESLYLKTQTVFSTGSFNSNKKIDYSRFFGFPLVNTDDSIQKVPSLSINFIDGTIESVVLDSQEEYEKYGSESIPQINLESKIVDIVVDVNFSKKILESNEIAALIAQDDTFIKIISRGIIFDIFEENVDNLKNNFELEVHKILKSTKNYTKLGFDNVEQNNIVDDILYDGPNEVTKFISYFDENGDLVDTYTEQDSRKVSSYYNISFDEMVEQKTPDRLYIYDPTTVIVPEGENC